MACNSNYLLFLSGYWLWKLINIFYYCKKKSKRNTHTQIKIAGRTINNLSYKYDTTLMAKSEEELKSLLVRVRKLVWNNIQRTKIMASSPITSWQTEGEKVEAVTDFLFLGSKITVDDDCSHEIKRHLLLGRKALTNLDSVFKSRDITLLTDVCRIKGMVFPAVILMWELDHKEG